MSSPSDAGINSPHPLINVARLLFIYPQWTSERTSYFSPNHQVFLAGSQVNLPVLATAALQRSCHFFLYCFNRRLASLEPSVTAAALAWIVRLR